MKRAVAVIIIIELCGQPTYYPYTFICLKISRFRRVATARLP